MEFQFMTIAVSDLTRSKAFYEGVLGLKPNGSYERWQSYEIECIGGFGVNEEPDLRRSPCSDIVNFSLSAV